MNLPTGLRQLRHQAVLVLGLTALLLTLPISEASANNDWTIDRFHADITVREDGWVDVVETIQADFHTQKHGIIRNLPYRYAAQDNQSGDKYIYTNIEVDRVEKGDFHEKYQEEKTDDYLNLRIGDSRVGDLEGEYTYTIHYRIEGVLRGFDDFDELYWNITGHDWDTTIRQATATIKLPQAGIIQTSCYEGAHGSHEQCSVMTMSNNQEVRLSGSGAIPAGQGLTAAVGFTKDMVPLRVVTPPTFADKLMEYQEVIVTTLITTLLGLIAVFLLWYRRGRDWWWETPANLQLSPEDPILKPLFTKHPLVVEYTPPQDLTPGLIGLLQDENADTLDITSTIIDLASRGYLTITEIKKKWLFGSTDYQFDRTEKSAKNLLGYEQVLLQRLFKETKQVNLSSLNDNFYQDLAEVKQLLVEEGQRLQFFVEQPARVKARYLVIAILILVIGVAALIALLNIPSLHWSIGALAGLIIPAIALIIVSFHMPQKTAQGRHLWNRIQGYRLFISTAEEHRQKFFEEQNLFTQILPYAMVFGLTDKFAQAMNSIGFKPQPPTWYHGTAPFNAALFAQNINTLSRTVSSTIASAPSSSGSGGGGSSGGGFGGGGGSSW